MDFPPVDDDRFQAVDTTDPHQVGFQPGVEVRDERLLESLHGGPIFGVSREFRLPFVHGVGMVVSWVHTMNYHV